MSDFYRPMPGQIFEAVEATSAPIVFDSPHSGTWYPPDFGFSCDAHRLRWAEDTYVDELWEAAVPAGAGYMRAFFPRSYLDVNRALEDIDVALFDGDWPGPVSPGEKVGFGVGVIRRLSLPDEPVYDRKLTITEGQHRIETYYKPYHAALGRLIENAHQRWGRVWHVNCHSMKEFGNAMNTDPGERRADFVLGDRDGTTCGPELRETIFEFLKGKGYSVTINAPYKGVELVRRYGRPREGRESIQVEINRALIINEETIEKIDRFPRVQADLAELVDLLVQMQAR